MGGNNTSGNPGKSSRALRHNYRSSIFNERSVHPSVHPSILSTDDEAFTWQLSSQLDSSVLPKQPPVRIQLNVEETKVEKEAKKKSALQESLGFGFRAVLSRLRAFSFLIQCVGKKKKHTAEDFINNSVIRR